MERLIRALNIYAAVQYIEECRHTHVVWIDFANNEATAEEIRVGGNAEHHARWVHNYDHVLKVLKSA